MIIAGIDIGQTGGLGIIDFISPDNFIPLNHYRLPYNGNQMDTHKLHEIIYFHAPDIELLAIEEQFRQSKTLIPQGECIAIAKILRIPYIIIPTVTKKGINSWYDDIGIKKENAKDKPSLRWCELHDIELPTLRPTGKVLHDGIADSYAIAYSGGKREWEKRLN